MLCGYTGEFAERLMPPLGELKGIVPAIFGASALNDSLGFQFID
jgi:hypothetical protein